MRPRLALAVLLAGLVAAVLAPARAATTLQLQAGRLQAPGFEASGVEFEARPDGRLSLRWRAARTRALPTPLRLFELHCRLQLQAGARRCVDGRLRLAAGPGSALRGRFTLTLGDDGDWQLALSQLRGELQLESADQRYAAHKLRFRASGAVRRRGAVLDGDLQLAIDAGEGYVEPLYLNFEQTPLRARTRFRLQGPRRTLQLRELDLALENLGHARGELQLELAQPRATLDAQLRLHDLQLATLLERLLAPFLVGTRLDAIAGSGRGSAELEVIDGRPQRLEVSLQDASLSLPRLALAWSGLSGSAHWQAQTARARPSQLAWQQLRWGRVDIAAATLRFRSAARDVELLSPLRLGLLGGALAVSELQLRELGRPAMSGRFDATLEPIDLAALCRALGWPEFQGRLGGRLPALRLQDEELSLGGRLEAEAFDGRIALDQLRVLQPFSRLPRIAADVTLRRLDLEAVTSAYSFGRITGRLDGDIRGLRLLGLKPVAMDAHLYTTPGDRSRHRISQRAIDNISRIGGGPAGVLSRSFLRVFDDFAYDRIGWRCVLDNGVCAMDGIEPAENGGYVLVRGKWLPRIEVIGYSRRVAWETFLGQLKAALEAEKAEIRR